MRLQRVVVGMDFSASAEAAARWTARCFAPGAELVLVHAIAVPEPPRFFRGRFPPKDIVVESARVGADKRMRELSESLGAQRIWLEIREGDPATQIAAVAAEYTADAIVVGPHGARTGVGQRPGGTAAQLLRNATIPVVLGTNVGEATPRRLLVPIDEAPITDALLGWARFLAEQYDADVTVLHVVSSSMLSGLLSAGAVVSGVMVPVPEEVLANAVQDAELWVDQTIAAAGLDAQGVHREVTLGDPVHEILGAAKRLESDMIILGSHTHGVRAALLGSVAREVLRGAARPVFVVRATQ
ncbi:MAG TPA: universal stress protein [Gemmatimonadaceae bacterium]